MRAVVLAAMFFLAASQIAAAEKGTPRVYADRSFGFFVGDLVRARVEIVADSSLILQSASLPRPGPLTYWLDLRETRVSEQPEPGGGRRWRVDLTYQIFYVALDVRDLEIPPFTMRFTGGEIVETALAPPWKIGVSPLREVLPQRRDDPADYLRADSVAPTVDTATPLRWTGALVAATLASLALVARDRGWPPFHRRRARAFAAASRRIAALAHSGGEAARREALLSLHRSIDETAGRRVFAEDVGAFLTAHSHFDSSREALERFFLASRRVFFGVGAGDDLSLGELADLARRLAVCERAGP